MIRRVWSDLTTFREARFEAGFNVVLADTVEDSEETDSTNGLGKTTLIRIIHFCLGADLARDKVLNHPDLAGVTFGLDLNVKGADVTISRNTSTPKRIEVTASFVAPLSIESEPINAELVAISLDDWKVALSKQFFPDARVDNSGQDHFSPSFRDIAVYLIRLGKPAFTDPQLSFQGQPGATKRLSLSFMLGLNWGLQRSIQNQITNRAQLKEAAKAVRSAELSDEQKTIGEMEAERVALETQLRTKREEVESFSVREDYRELENNLIAVDRKIHDLINENYADARLRDYYVQSSTEVPEADASRPLSILRDAGATFKEEALREIEEVSAFHKEVYRNRKEFLQEEIARLSRSIEERTIEVDTSSTEKQRLLSVLRTSGAMDTLIALQRSYTELNARKEVLSSLIEQRKQFDRRADEIAATIARDKTLLKNDLEDRRDAIDEVRALFAEYTQKLYGRPGRLGVDVGKEGYSFSFTIDRGGSDGVDQMVVFCFDLTVATVWARHARGFPVLIHDSTLFADVDPRQYAAALKLAADCSVQYGFQYICCLNVGSLPREHLGDFDLDSFVRLRLTDEGPRGRLLGKQLPPHEKDVS
jgi:uncharacterized protein YydD (DUF2326 family)